MSNKKQKTNKPMNQDTPEKGTEEQNLYDVMRAKMDEARAALSEQAKTGVKENQKKKTVTIGNTTTEIYTIGTPPNELEDEGMEDTNASATASSSGNQDSTNTTVSATATDHARQG